MRGIILDENLPRLLRLPTQLSQLHASEIAPSAKDSVLWEYARLNSWVIITKDADFSNRIILGRASSKSLSQRAYSRPGRPLGAQTALNGLGLRVHEGAGGLKTAPAPSPRSLFQRRSPRRFAPGLLHRTN